MSAMGCPEVVYQAYYPYLYQRATAAGAVGVGVARQPPFPPFSHHYDRGSQRGLGGLDASCAPPDGFLAHHSSSGSVSSGGGGVGSPGSPPRRKDGGACAENEEDDGGDGDDDETRSRAQYLSANCVVFTHYSGDVEAVVDQHFTRALSDFAADKAGAIDKLEASPMSARNFPASFWNSSYQGPAHYDAFHGGAPGDPWHSHYQQYSVAAHHHRAVQEYHHHHNMAAQYGGLLLPSGGVRGVPAHHAHHAAHHAAHAYAKAEPWPSAHARLHHDAPAHSALDAPYAAYPGLDSQVQESSKDLYWF